MDDEKLDSNYPEPEIRETIESLEASRAIADEFTGAFRTMSRSLDKSLLYFRGNESLLGAGTQNTHIFNSTATAVANFSYFLETKMETVSKKQANSLPETALLS